MTDDNITVQDLTSELINPEGPASKESGLTNQQNNNEANKTIYLSTIRRDERDQALRFAIDSHIAVTSDGLLHLAKKIDSYRVNGYWIEDKAPSVVKGKPGRKAAAKAAPKKKAAKKAPLKKAAKKGAKRAGPGRPAKKR